VTEVGAAVTTKCRRRPRLILIYCPSGVSLPVAAKCGTECVISTDISFVRRPSFIIYHSIFFFTVQQPAAWCHFHSKD